MVSRRHIDGNNNQETLFQKNEAEDVRELRSALLRLYVELLRSRSSLLLGSVDLLDLLGRFEYLVVAVAVGKRDPVLFPLVIERPVPFAVEMETERSEMKPIVLLSPSLGYCHTRPRQERTVSC